VQFFQTLNIITFNIGFAKLVYTSGKAKKRREAVLKKLIKCFSMSLYFRMPCSHKTKSSDGLLTSKNLPTKSLLKLLKFPDTTANNQASL